MLDILLMPSLLHRINSTVVSLLNPLVLLCKMQHVHIAEQCFPHRTVGIIKNISGRKASM